MARFRHPGDCDICDHVDAHDWVGPNADHHCRACGARWRGKAKSHCTVCHRTFSSNSAGDSHQKRNECLSDRTLQRRGLVRRTYESPLTPVWGWAPPPEDGAAPQQRTQ